MIDREAARLAEGQHGVFSLRQFDNPVTPEQARHRVEGGRWEPSGHPGVFRLAGSPRTWAQSLIALVLATGPGSAASHRSAAALLGLPGFPRTPIEVTTSRRWRRRAKRETVHSSRLLPPGHLTVVEGIAVTRIPRLIVDLAGILPPGRVARALDNCLAAGTATVPSVREVTEELAKQGRKGISLLRILLDERRDGYVAPASELERLFLQICHSAHLEEPEKQVNVGDAKGWVGRVDFAYPWAKVLIELDGRRHHSALLDADSDRHRDHRLVAGGWRILRFNWDDLTKRPEEVVQTLRRVLALAAS